MCAGVTEDITEILSISSPPLSMVIVGVPSVVESDRFPPTLVAPPLSRSLEPRTPLSALQLPRSPACPWAPPMPPQLLLPPDNRSSELPRVVALWWWLDKWGNIKPLLLPAPGVVAPFMLLLVGYDTSDSWSLRQMPLPPNCRWSCE